MAENVDQSSEEEADRTTHSVASAAMIRRAVAAASVGNVIEFFDNVSFGLLAATIGRVFFPSDNPTAVLLSSFGAFAVTFVARPFGGLLFGSIGDRLGRQRTLVMVITLMSVATVVIGVLPGYAVIGLAAPVILLVLRVLQGLSFGGEIGGAVSFVAEYSRKERRGRAIATVMAAALVGNILAVLLVTGLSAVLADEQMATWGWRIPFLIAGPLGLVGLFIRLKLDEAPVFRELHESGAAAKAPLRHTISTQPLSLAVCACLSISVLLSVYLMEAYNTNFLREVVQVGPTVAYVSTLVASLVAMVGTIGSGVLSDRIGRKPVLAASCIGFLVLVYPAYVLLADGSVWGAIGGQALFGGLRGAYTGVVMAAMIELFPTVVRYSGFSIAYNLAAVVFGGTAPLVATYFVEVSGNVLAPAFYLMAAAALSLLMSLKLKETARTALVAETD